MLYRAAITGIIAFWLVMMFQLVRLETHPETTNILDVPVPYVMRLLLRHKQLSFLTIRDDSKQLGTLYLRPVTTGSDSRTLNFSGGISVDLPSGPAPRLNFTGVIDMDGALNIRDFRSDFSVLKPSFRLSLKGDSARNTLTWQTQFGDHPSAPPQTLPMDAAGLTSTLTKDLGLHTPLPIDPTGITPPTVTAREAQITLVGDQVEVYEVDVTEGTTPVIEFYVTQLGQIVSAKTNFGYNLSVEGWQ
jgi:hypothetical protein